MDRGVKIVLASGVLLGGAVIALLFRHQSPRANPPLPGSSGQLVLRDRQPDLVQRPATDDLGTRHRAFDPSGPKRHTSAPPATIVTPMKSAEPPPQLAKTYPQVDGPTTSRWGTSMGLDMPRRPRDDNSPRTHKVLDGDTLGALAARYLGDVDRVLEIYQANRDVLSNPDVLPIGVELKIPPRRCPRPAETDPLPRRPLVPVRADAVDHGTP